MEVDSQMATQIINHTYKLKRGSEDAIARVNPVLEAGEPIVVFCNDGETRLKIGNGVDPYDALNFIGEKGNQEVITLPTHFDFPYPPTKDQINAIFKAVDEAKLWQWNQEKYKYEELNVTEADIQINNIEIISGGEALELLKD